MKLTNIIYILCLPILVITACHRTDSPTYKSKINVEEHATDTFPDKFADREAYREFETKALISGMLDTLNTEQYISDKYNSKSIYSGVVEFYSLQDSSLAWYSRQAPLEKTEKLMAELIEPGKYGLYDFDYDIFKLVNRQNALYSSGDIRPVELAELDIRTTIAAITFAWHLHNGTSLPSLETGLQMKSGEKSSVARVLAEESIEDAFEILIPKDVFYASTLKAINRYEEIRENGGWKKLPEDLLLKRGDSSRYIPEIRSHLHQTGDYSGDLDGVVFDKPLEEGVRRYQERHNMEADGVVGGKTLDELNKSVEERIAMLKLNLERMRWMPSDPGEEYIVINIPEYMLNVFKNGKNELNMNVIVGSRENKTPLFHDELEYIVFSPTWTVPRSIVRDEMLPLIMKDKSYFDNKDYRVYNSWTEEAEEINPKKVKWSKISPDSIMIVQAPGASNALGRIKFMMPNSESIYLHDTPTDYLFAEPERAFSHGCIRVEFPETLAAYLLQDQSEWSESEITKSMDLHEPKPVRLNRKIPVYLTYRTAWADDSGRVHFRNDVYEIDTTDRERLALK